jgi:RNA polymerase sigma factor (sigma-70 family)
MYLGEIGRYSLLTRGDEIALAQAVEAGRSARAFLEHSDPGLDVGARRAASEAVTAGDAAATAFVEANLRLVVSVARRYQAAGAPLADLIQDGNIGLMHAVDRFDWRKGFKFSTYATWWIRQAVTRAASATTRTIRLPVHAAEIAANAHRLRYEMFERQGRHIPTAELAAALGVTETYLVTLLASAGATISLSEPVGPDRSTELGETIGDPSGISPAEAATDSTVAADIRRLLCDNLTTREAQIVSLRFGLDGVDPLTLDDVGRRYGLTRERVRQIEQAALVKLRHPRGMATVRSLLDG